MLFLVILAILAILVNNNYISYNENILLCVFFILFFIIAYIGVKQVFKAFVFKKIFNNFFLILFAVRITYFFNNLIIYTNSIKYNILKKYINKIFLLKKKYITSIHNIFNKYLTLILFSYFIVIKVKFRVIEELIHLVWNKHIKKNDIFFLF
jgi:hypothetical protein